MASKSITLILVLYFVFAASAGAGPSTRIFRGLKAVPTDAEAPSSNDPESHFVALDPKDPKVVELGNFVIDQQNKDGKSKLNFGSVLKAASSGSGEELRYGLVIGASDTSGSSDEYYAYVVVDQGAKKLVAFKKSN